jgi:hypothetical protein
VGVGWVLQEGGAGAPLSWSAGYSAASVRWARVEPAGPFRTCRRWVMRRRSSGTWLMTPTVRSWARRESRTSRTLWRVSSSRVPKPSSMNRVSRGLPPASWVTTSARPRARDREAKKDSPPESVSVLRGRPVQESVISRPRPDRAPWAAWWSVRRPQHHQKQLDHRPAGHRNRLTRQAAGGAAGPLVSDQPRGWGPGRRRRGAAWGGRGATAWPGTAVARQWASASSSILLARR